MGTLTDGRPVVVVGAGLTGASWAGLFAAAGLRVRLLDRDLDRARAGAAQAEEAARFLVAHGLADRDAAEHGTALLGATDQPAAAYADVQLVQECVVERLDVKRAVFALAEAHAPADALLATSSSGLSITAIQEGLVRPERSLAAHPYNPPHLVPVVELAPGERTAPGTLDRAEAFYRSVGKEPVVLRRDLPGYIGNRLSAALWREAVALVLAGDASVDDVDRTVRFGPGLRWAAMGPHLLYHLGGGAGGIRGHLEHLGAVKEGMLRDLATWTTFPEATADLLEAGVREEIGERREEDLVRERDAALVAFRRTSGATRSAPDEQAASRGADRALADAPSGPGRDADHPRRGRAHPPGPLRPSAGRRHPPAPTSARAGRVPGRRRPGPDVAHRRAAVRARRQLVDRRRAGARSPLCPAARPWWKPSRRRARTTCRGRASPGPPPVAREAWRWRGAAARRHPIAPVSPVAPARSGSPGRSRRHPCRCPPGRAPRWGSGCSGPGR